MGKYILSLILIFGFGKAFSQANSLTASGGYAFTLGNEFSKGYAGWRLCGLYEYHPKVSKLLHGFSFGYIRTYKEIQDSHAGNPSKYANSTVPLYYAPKYLIGNGSLQGFVKGAAGVQFSTSKSLGSLNYEVNQTGIYGGLGVGLMKSFKEKYFVNLEYEWAYLSNSFYNNNFLNTLMIGIASRFD